MLLECILAGVLVLVVSVIVYARWSYGTLESLGIPVVNRSFMLGSLPDLHKRIVHEDDIQFYKEHGPIYGVYEGRTPIVYVCDPDLIKRVMVTDHQYFKNRRQFDFGDDIMNEMMDFLEYDKWKTVRSQLTPSMTIAKIKKTVKDIDPIVNKFIKSLHEKCGDAGQAKVDMRRTFTSLMISTTAKFLYDLNVEDADNDDNFFRLTAKELMGEDGDFNFIYPLTLSFPILTKLAPTLAPPSIKEFRKLVEFAIQERRQPASPPQGDFVDRMIAILDQLHTDEYRNLNIKEETVYAHAIGNFFGGFDTVTNAIVFLAYYMARYPDLQGKLLEEVDKYFETHSQVSHETLSELTYLAACIDEVLRIAPTFRISERNCTEDYKYGSMQFKKGTTIMVPAWALHRNPQHFPNPDQFNPERFLPENKQKINPHALNLFGHGPRNCIGQRYALDVLKVCLLQIFKDFRFEIRHDTKIQFKPGRLFLLHYHSLYLNIIERNK